MRRVQLVLVDLQMSCFNTAGISSFQAKWNKCIELNWKTNRKLVFNCVVWCRQITFWTSIKSYSLTHIITSCSSYHLSIGPQNMHNWKCKTAKWFTKHQGCKNNRTRQNSVMLRRLSPGLVVFLTLLLYLLLLFIIRIVHRVHKST